MTAIVGLSVLLTVAVVGCSDRNDDDQRTEEEASREKGILGRAADTAKTAGKAVGGAAKTAGEAVGGAAKTAGKAVGSAAKTAGHAVGSAAKTTGQAVGGAAVTAGKAVGNAAKTAGKATAHGVKTAAVATRDFVAGDSDSEGLELTDEDIQAEIEDLLDREASIDADKIEVTVDEGDVVLHFDDPAKGQVDAAVDVARRARGVKKVKADIDDR